MKLHQFVEQYSTKIFCQCRERTSHQVNSNELLLRLALSAHFASDNHPACTDKMESILKGSLVRV
jgi:hypothetical protein